MLPDVAGRSRAEHAQCNCLSEGVVINKTPSQYQPTRMYALRAIRPMWMGSRRDVGWFCLDLPPTTSEANRGIGSANVKRALQRGQMQAGAYHQGVVEWRPACCPAPTRLLHGCLFLWLIEYHLHCLAWLLAKHGVLCNHCYLCCVGSVQGFMRQVPLVGGMLSWLMPAEPAPAISGRSLNLQSGEWHILLLSELFRHSHWTYPLLRTALNNVSSLLHEVLRILCKYVITLVRCVCGTQHQSSYWFDFSCTFCWCTKSQPFCSSRSSRNTWDDGKYLQIPYAGHCLSVGCGRRGARRCSGGVASIAAFPVGTPRSDSPRFLYWVHRYLSSSTTAAAARPACLLLFRHCSLLGLFAKLLYSISPSLVHVQLQLLPVLTQSISISDFFYSANRHACCSLSSFLYFFIFFYPPQFMPGGMLALPVW